MWVNLQCIPVDLLQSIDGSLLYYTAKEVVE